MNSMNLTSMGLSLANYAKSANSSQLKFRIATTFTLTEGIPNDRAKSMPYMAAAEVFGLLVINSFLEGMRESILIFMWVRPASTNRGNLRFSKVPLVVIAICS